MAQTSFFADTLNVVYKTASGTAITVGVLQGVDIRAEWDHVELYGQETVFREDIARINVRVPVNVKVAKFHPEMIGLILGTENADEDIDGGASAGNTMAEITDTNTCPLFDIWGTVTGKNSETYNVKVTNVSWENAPWAAPQGEYMVNDLTGVGDKMYIGYVTV